MEKEGLTLYKQKGGYQSMGWQVNNSILKGGGDFVVPAALLYINNNFDCKSCNSVEKGVVNRDLYDKLYIGVSSDQSSDQKLFSIEKRIEMTEDVTKSIDNVVVVQFDGLLVDVCTRLNCKVIVRGLRALSDYEYEFKMALMNRSLDDNIVTLFMMPHERYTHISSSLIKEVASHGGNISEYVPTFVNKALGEAL